MYSSNNRAANVSDIQLFERAATVKCFERLIRCCLEMCSTYLLLVLVTILKVVTSQSPCPTDVFRRSSDQSGIWLGELILRSEFTLSGLWIRLEFDSRVQLVGSTFDASISSKDNTNFQITAPEFILDPSSTLTVSFFVKYSELDALPEVRAVFLNGRPLCPGSDVTTVQKVSPCPNVFLYEREDTDRWFGNLTIRTDVELRGIWVKMALDGPAQLVGTKFGSVKASDNQNFVIEDRDYTMKPGSALDIPFFVKSSPLDPIPGVESVRLNARTICGTLVQDSNNKPTNRTVGMPTDAGRIQPVPENPELDGISIPALVTNSSFQPESNEPFVLPKFRCGVTELGDRIFFGRPTTIEQFPWHGAIFHSTEYACGMSLISPYHAVTAAHCFDNSFKEPVDIKSVKLYFGLSNLRKFYTPDVQAVRISKLFKHPQYMFHIPRFDIAVIKFDREVKFSSKIQPICLWLEDSDLKTVENKSGVIVGFGLTEVGSRSEQLLWGRILVVDSDTCRELNPTFYVKLSRYSYCAGNLTRTSVCRGDSGGGMFFQKPGTEIWQLRGITSTSKVRDQGLSCDNSYYAIFTDAARYKEWIEQQMLK